MASSSTTEPRPGNSLLSGVPDSEWAADRLALSREPAVVDGRRMVRVYRGATGHTDLDAVALVAVDHDPASRVELLPGRVVAGEPVEPLEIRDRDGRDISSRFQGDPSTSFVADSGDAVILTFPTAPTGSGPAALLFTGRAVSRTDGRPSGFLVQVRDGGGWRTVTHHHPRSLIGESSVDSVDGNEVRLLFLGNGTLTHVSRLLPGANFTRHDLVSAAALHSRLGGVEPGVLAEGADNVTLDPADTLYAYFTPPADPAPGTTRSWFLRVRGRQSGGDGVESSRSRPTGEPTTAPPTRFALRQNVPNPFRGTTAIAFDLPVSARVSLEVFDTQGRRVRQLGGAYAAGRHSVDWDLRSDRGERVAPGVYLYRMRAGAFRAERKMIVLP